MALRKDKGPPGSRFDTAGFRFTMENNEMTRHRLLPDTMEYPFSEYLDLHPVDLISSESDTPLRSRAIMGRFRN